MRVSDNRAGIKPKSPRANTSYTVGEQDQVSSNLPLIHHPWNSECRPLFLEIGTLLLQPIGHKFNCFCRMTETFPFDLSKANIKKVFFFCYVMCDAVIGGNSTVMQIED